VLAEIEDQLRGDRGADFRLADEFDYIAGTSTGAIIATCLSLGMSVAEIRDFYRDSGTAMFDKASLLRRFRSKYEDEKLAAKLRRSSASTPRWGPTGCGPCC
jgi:patatin-like phospholipase/acyl hydrolase